MISSIGGWTNQELVQYLRTGHVEGKAQAGGGMAEAVQNSFQHMSDADLQAIASYLKTVKPVRNAQQQTPAYSVDKAKTADWESSEFPIDNNATPSRHDNLSNLSGVSLYNSACAACHGMQGEGTPDQVIPSLSRNSAVGAELANNVVMAISQGIYRETQGTMASMPAFSAQAEHITSTLSPAQIASVTNYVMAQYGKDDPGLTEQDVLQIQQGGGSSFLICYAALLAWIGFGAGAIFLLVALIFMVKFCRKKR
ncbi:hypothetical protein BBB56_22840 [Candidatus Pantoea deserta]|uniref:Cytochrome c domain-containing protein n=1 Tax=Candidatus Pantoea deserta TaxID=1869313 RepID=A0A3N4NND7_9GAMM|nr:cytochrome c [Pantoea deserta]RPD93079.1 hypothetical protein BBB56_22840 [Pantoea deserta]